MDVVRGALRCLVDRERVTVQVNTLDLELVRAAAEPMLSTLGGIDALRGSGGPPRAARRSRGAERCRRGGRDHRGEAAARPPGARGRAAAMSEHDLGRLLRRAQVERPARAPRPRGQPDRPDHRGDRARGRGRRGLRGRGRPRPRPGARRGRRLPRPAHAADAARRDARHRARATPSHATGQPFRVPVGEELLGRVLDGLGRPIDGAASRSTAGALRPIAAAPPDPLARPRIERARRRSACARSTRSCPAAAASASASSPARASASPRCSA